MFISGGEVHLIPPNLLPQPPPAMDAVAAVQSANASTRAPPAVNNTIQSKVEG